MRRIRVVVREDCPVCGGDKRIRIPSKPARDGDDYALINCLHCNGTGWVEEEEDFETLLLDADVMFEPDDSDW